MELDTATLKPGNGARRPRRSSALSAHAPGQPLGEAVKELLGLAGVARLLAAGLGGAATEVDCKDTAEHLAARLEHVVNAIADLDLELPRSDA